MKTLIISNGKTMKPDSCIIIGDVVKVCDRDTSEEFYAYAVHDNNTDDCTCCALHYVPRCTDMGCVTNQFMLKRIDNIVEYV